jgi:hypothetical protein
LTPLVYIHENLTQPSVLLMDQVKACRADSLECHDDATEGEGGAIAKKGGYDGDQGW